MSDQINTDLKNLVTAIATDNNEKAEQALHNVLQAKMQALLAKKVDAAPAETAEEEVTA